MSWEKAFIEDNIALINGDEEMDLDPLGNWFSLSILCFTYFLLGRDDIVARIQAEGLLSAGLAMKQACVMSILIHKVTSLKPILLAHHLLNLQPMLHKI